MITMDTQMPRCNGYEATRQIMETHPLPIVMVTGSRDPKEVQATFQALEAGAVTILEKPVGPRHPKFCALAKELVETVKLSAEVKVVRRTPKRVQKLSPPLDLQLTTPPSLLAIGASTGGPVAVQKLLQHLSSPFPLPIALAQHIAESFVAGFAEWLQATTPFSVTLGSDGEKLQPGRVYLAPEGHHLGFRERGRLALEKRSCDDSNTPSISHLFKTAAETYGQRAIGLLLTGMGRDGADGLLWLRERGALTLVQSKASCAVFGMPKAALELKASDLAFSPEEMAAYLGETLRGRGL